MKIAAKIFGVLRKNISFDCKRDLIQVVIVGNGAVGKSSMIQRYCRGTFTKTYKKTIGVDFLEKQLRVHGEDVRLMLWDTAGQEEFDAITKVSIVSLKRHSVLIVPYM